MPRIWGARDLSPLFPERSQEPEPVGEAWLTGNECRFATGEFAGRTLGDVWPELPVEWTGTRLRGLDRIPLLVKFIFPEEKLSVQVHPDDAYADQHESAAGGIGKTEMWYVVKAREGAELRVGLRPDGKPRPLHVRHALNVMRFGEQSGGRCDPVRITHGAVTETFFVACQHFATERWEFRERIAAVTSPEHFDLLIFLDGKGRIEFGEGAEAYG